MNLYRVRELRRTTLNLDHPDAEFGRVHPSEKVWQVENAMTYAVEAEFKTKNAAIRYAQRNGKMINEAV